MCGELPSPWRSNSNKTLRTVQGQALSWSTSTCPSGLNSSCLIDGPPVSQFGILSQGCMSPGCPAFLSSCQSWLQHIIPALRVLQQTAHQGQDTAASPSPHMP